MLDELLTWLVYFDWKFLEIVQKYPHMSDPDFLAYKLQLNGKHIIQLVEHVIQMATY